MAQILHFSNGRLDPGRAPAHLSRDVTISDEDVAFALQGLPPHLHAHYPSDPPPAQTVPLGSIVLDFSQRLVDYDRDRLRRILTAFHDGTRLPPLSVDAANHVGAYPLQNRYHRFIASALVGFAEIPIDQQPPAPLAVAAPVVAWRPRQQPRAVMMPDFGE